jgi:hypothetical protein
VNCQDVLAERFLLAARKIACAAFEQRQNLDKVFHVQTFRKLVPWYTKKVKKGNDKKIKVKSKFSEQKSCCGMRIFN